ncbi:PHD finger protein 24-like [Ptychodera flava]|uniref:PHD finger protein 24-like n=1 Tax=Ptychodera flava TaxID=63121 RepID=UPI00396AB092
MDKNNDGSISWSEFINTEALEYLFRRRSQNQLVQMLTPLEIDRIRMIFCRFDEGSRGVITIDESQEVLEEWRGRLGFGKSSAAVSDFVKTHKINLECERLVSWEVFIRENALTFISARPNTVDMKPFVVTEESLHRLHLKQCDDIRNDEANGNRGRKVSTFRW